MAEINVVPYIDVMLVLLIIFMVTAPLLPRARSTAAGGREARPAVAWSTCEATASSPS
jgi:biopolymer transport protein ExbD